MANIGDTLKSAIRTSGKSIYEICKATGLDKGAMSRFMSGKVGLRTESADKLCDFFNLELVAKSKPTSKAKPTAKRKGNK